MMEPPTPANESQRLDSLKKLNLLDTPIEERFERITRMLKRSLGVEIASFVLLDSDRQFFKSIQGLNSTETPRKDSFCAHLIASDDDSLYVGDAKKDPRFADNPLVTGAPGISFYAGCPVRSPDGQRIGALCAIDGKARDITEEELQMLKDFASMVETELRTETMKDAQQRLISELDQANRIALIDSMTRIWNRAGITELMKRECSEAARRRTAMGVVMCDIDHFKKVNDTHGHPVGDEVIREVAHRLLSALRTEDAIGRVGGEEFLIVLPNCAPESLFATVERIRAKLVAEPVATAAGELPITMSFGALSVVPEKAAEIDPLVKKADDALYKAKHGGRNRTEVAA
ncbi:MAG: sensor domain-containing diguanylate cyclase [Micavibrio sp.]|nr:sensor domain-containing diguanylate cyclase [Micavibrio sp.]